MASPLREGVPTVEQFLAWDFTVQNARFIVSFLNTLMRDYGTMTPPKKDYGDFLRKCGFDTGETILQQLAYRRMGNRRYASMVRDFEGINRHSRKKGRIITHGYANIMINMSTMEIERGMQMNDPHMARRERGNTSRIV